MYPAPPATIIFINPTPSESVLFANLRIVAGGIERGVLRSHERDVVQGQIPDRFVGADGLGVVHHCLPFSSDVDRPRQIAFQQLDQLLRQNIHPKPGRPLINERLFIRESRVAKRRSDDERIVMHPNRAFAGQLRPGVLVGGEDRIVLFVHPAIAFKDVIGADVQEFDVSFHANPNQVRGADDVDVQRELRVLVNLRRRREGRSVENRGDGLSVEVGDHIWKGPLCRTRRVPGKGPEELEVSCDGRGDLCRR